MNKLKVLAAALGMTALLSAAIACGNSEAAASPGPSQSGGQAPAGTSDVGAPATGAPVGVAVAPRAPQPEAGVSSMGVTTAAGVAPAYSGFPLQQANGSQTGIWVTGEAVVTLGPDLAVINIGVEATGKTVAEARDKAAKAMDAIIAALHARGIQDKDIQTQYFNIYPRYEYQEVMESGVRTGKQVLVGYVVNNSATVKVRDLEAVGTIVDELVAAGGDETRINGISFTVEDPKPLMNDLREAAVKDAIAKAEQFAALTGVTLGKLVYISEVSASAPVILKDYGLRSVAEAAAPMPTTPISGGELEVRLMVQAVFAIP